MRNVILIILFFVGLGIAFGAHLYFREEPTDQYSDVSLRSEYCNMACCLPGDESLSDVQKQELMKLERSYCQCRDQLSVQIDKKRLALADVLLQTAPDMEAIDRLLEETANLQAELEKETIKHILGIKSHLDPRDRERFIKPIVAEIRKRCRQGQPAAKEGGRNS